MSFLDEMAASSQMRLAQAQKHRPLSALRAALVSAPPVRPLNPAKFLLIAEVKRNSPALGPLGDQRHPDISRRVRAYSDGGAQAISVLTEPSRFGGSLDDLAEAAAATTLPVMRKDFLVDPYQVVEARASGASGVLFIIRMVSDHQLADMLHAAADLGMFTLLEAFDERDAERAGRVRAPASRVLVGVNSRDLATLEVHPTRLADLRSALPSDLPAIAESGIQSPQDVARAAQCGYDGALVGGALMKAADPAALCRDMISAGISARSDP